MDARLTVKEQFGVNDSERLIEFYRENPCVAIKEIFNIDLTWFQRIAVRAFWHKKFIIFLFSRGLSKTFLGSVLLVLWAMLYPKTKIGIIAPSYRQTYYLLDFIDEFLDNSAYIRNSVKTRNVVRGNMRSILRFKNGSIIESLPIGDGNRIRGRRYNVVLIDEYAQMDDQVVRLVIIPMMNIKKKGIDNKMLLCSTAWWTFGHFYSTYVSYRYYEMEENSKYAVCEFDIDDLKMTKDSPFELDMDLVNRMKDDPNTTVEEFLMENYCEFPTESHGFITPQLIQQSTPSPLQETYIKMISGEPIVFEGSPVELQGVQGVRYVMGVDVARSAKGDNFAVCIIKIDGNYFRVVNCWADSGLSFQFMSEILRIYIEDFNLSAVYMDASGGGAALKDLLMTNWIDVRTNKKHSPIIDAEDKELQNINGLKILYMKNFTQPFISLMYHSLKASMQHDKLKLPIDRRRDPDIGLEKICQNIIHLKQELVMLRAESAGPYVKFTTSSKQKKDRATALGLANLAANEIGINQMIEDSEKKSLAVGNWV